MLNKVTKKLNYLRRIFQAYLGSGISQLSFWHGKPKVNNKKDYKKIGQYYMPFLYKAKYKGYFDKNGVPLLDYRGKIGKQYNPIAIAQYGLGHYNLYKKEGDKKNLKKAIKQADWLVDNLEKNKKGVFVWMHHFDWEYREGLKAPWYSALAQGQGISLLIRAYKETNKDKYFKSAKTAFISLNTSIDKGGVQFIDQDNNVWLEEYIVSPPPSHVLNGFIWTLWGVYDFYLLTKDSDAKKLFNNCIKTLKQNLKRFDIGFWSLYDLSPTFLKTIASTFYHKLHIVQLEILYKITNENIFLKFKKKWQRYENNIFYKTLALIYKIIFKIFYY